MFNILVFEDRYVSQLAPITTGRPTYAISCGSFRLVDWIGLLEGNRVGLVRPYLTTIQLLDYPCFKLDINPELEYTWVINARLVPSIGNWRRLIRFQETAMTRYRSDLASGRTVADMQNGILSTAILPTSELSQLNSSAWQLQLERTGQSPPSAVITDNCHLELFQYPHEVVDYHLKSLGENLAYRIAHDNLQQIQDGVFFGRAVQVGPHVVFDTSQGPIVVDDEATLGPFSLLRGPVYLGPRSRLNEYASIKDHVSIADHSKIGGEVEAAVIESYTNKQHHGFLGHSYLGSWINLGAGTCNSDLKNTYGQVNMEYRDRKVGTGMQLMGCIIGDYSKSAINTSIFTGKVIGVASMLYGFVTTNVPSFVNYARTFGEIGLLPPDVIVSTQQRMFGRRNVEQRPCDMQLIHDMFMATSVERPADLSDKPISL